MEKYSFQYCQKLVIFSNNLDSVLLCKRKGEADYDGVYSFAGGKMETTDIDIIDGLTREKNEELGKEFKINIYTRFTTNFFFKKKDGNSMILPHYFAIHKEGDVQLNEEYSDYKWVKLEELDTFEPKIETIPLVVTKILQLQQLIKEGDLTEI